MEDGFTLGGSRIESVAYWHPTAASAVAALQGWETAAAAWAVSAALQS